MKKTTLPNASPSFMLFMMSLCLGFLGLIMPWSSAYFRTLSVDASMYNQMGQPLSFWQTSFFALVFRQAPCRTLIATQANTPQGNILNSLQTVGFSILFVLVFLWLVFVWVNRKVMTQGQRKFLLRTSMVLIGIATLIVVRIATFADCSLIKSIELLDVQFLEPVLLFPVFSIAFGMIAIIKSRTMSKAVESD